MKVICAGMLKTGTKSITKALRQLGFTVFDWEEQNFDFLDHWVDVFHNGVKPDVKRVYQNADAAVDYPGNIFYEEILEVFPDCKVILSERDEDSWVKSLVNQRAVAEAERFYRMSMLSSTARKIYYVYDCYLDAHLGSRNPKSTSVIRKRYRIHNNHVKTTVPADKLLVYNVKQGWKPLCDFLGCEVPKSPFPHENVKGSISTIPMDMSRWGRQELGTTLVDSKVVFTFALSANYVLDFQREC
ncbi:hypothetical protein ACROYT_G024249 [Oculina patagonica]